MVNFVPEYCFMNSGAIQGLETSVSSIVRLGCDVRVDITYGYADPSNNNLDLRPSVDLFAIQGIRKSAISMKELEEKRFDREYL